MSLLWLANYKDYLPIHKHNDEDEYPIVSYHRHKPRRPWSWRSHKGSACNQMTWRLRYPQLPILTLLNFAPHYKKICVRFYVNSCLIVLNKIVNLGKWIYTLVCIFMLIPSCHYTSLHTTCVCIFGLIFYKKNRTRARLYIAYCWINENLQKCKINCQ